MAKKAIPDEIKREVHKIVDKFNQTDPSGRQYRCRFRGRFLYLGLPNPNGTPFPIGRMTYTGKMDEWEFAIYKYSSERYDPDEWFFPGTGHLDGTVEGGMRAGLEAYPG